MEYANIAQKPLATIFFNCGCSSRGYFWTPKKKKIMSSLKASLLRDYIITIWSRSTHGLLRDACRKDYIMCRYIYLSISLSIYLYIYMYIYIVIYIYKCVPPLCLLFGFARLDFEQYGGKYSAQMHLTVMFGRSKKARTDFDFSSW